MKKLYIIHGYGSGSTNNWFPWLKSEVEKLGVEVIVPDMPHSDAPQFSEWLSHIQAQVINPDEETFFVGHSLGCITIIQYLNNCNPDTRIGGAVFVAGFSSPIHLTELNSFFEIPLDNEKIKKGRR
jgi:uncharacterized protein